MSAEEVREVPAFATLSEWRRFSREMTPQRCRDLVLIELQSLLPNEPSEISRFDEKDARFLYSLHRSMRLTGSKELKEHRTWMASLDNDNLEFFLVVLLRMEKSFHTFTDSDNFIAKMRVAKEIWTLRHLGDDSLINDREVMTVGPGSWGGLYRPDLSTAETKKKTFEVLNNRIELLAARLVKTAEYFRRVFVGDSKHSLSRHEIWNALCDVCGFSITKRPVYLAVIGIVEYFNVRLKSIMPMPPKIIAAVPNKKHRPKDTQLKDAQPVNTQSEDVQPGKTRPDDAQSEAVESENVQPGKTHASDEIYRDMERVDMQEQNMDKQNMVRRDMVRRDMVRRDMIRRDMDKQDMDKQDMDKQDMVRRDMIRRDMDKRVTDKRAMEERDIDK
ncbi:hypothetical protein QBC41DRAFT_387347 [Cercophora samala]|uniref:Uncharacterized protein n=1 Tax=Cercophora samala TaxID=330535 RepID=A0AA40DBU4_9PEZI|nr:hypothetical protein QBC41DRAFT_387347 [Cercophora samala]